MRLTGWWEHSSEMLLHVEMIVSHCCCRYVACTSMIWISHSTTFSGWSIGLRSCDSWGYFSTMNSLWCSGKQKFWAFVRGRVGCTKIRDSNADSLYLVQELHWEKKIRSTRGSLGVRREPSSIWTQMQGKTHSKHHNNPDYDSFVTSRLILLKAPIRRCVNSGDKLAYMVSKTQLGKLSWYGAKCAKKISRTPLNQPEPLIQDRMNPCIYVVHAKYWSHQRLWQKSSVRQHLLLCNFSEPV